MKNRLDPRDGEWIDRQRTRSFRFEGQVYTGYAGDVLATALWANDVRLMARSFKYHRPRSFYSLANHDANFLVEDTQRTNLRGDILPLEEGLDVHAVNTWGGLQRDWLRITERFARFLPVGFYYKAFHTPRWLFPFYENQMRRVAGLGRVLSGWTARRTPKDYAFCDVIVIGAGPAGLSAALTAADEGADVLLVDEMPRPGGSLAWQHASDPKAQAVLKTMVDRARQHNRLRLRMATQAAGCYADHWLALVDAQRLTKLRTKALIVASGCYEQPAVFQNNDLPGVMLGSAAQRLLNLYAIRPFQTAVILTANAEGYGVARDLLDAGVKVSAVVDLRADSVDAVDHAAAATIPIHRGEAIAEALPDKDGTRVAGVRVVPLNSAGQLSSTGAKQIVCDGVAVSVGWTPCADVLYQAGARFGYDSGLEQLVPTSLPAGVIAAGGVRGVYDWPDEIEDGRQAGLAACAHLGYDVETPSAPVTPHDVAHSHPYPVFPHPGKKNFVDFDEDLHLADFVHSHREGYDNIELLKRYSTVGMGPSQGKLSNMNAVRILARLNQRSIEQTGTTTSRPFHQPVSIELLAGRRFHPERRTPLHDWHVAHRAQLVRVGDDWLRPEYYLDGTQPREQCILNEAVAVRGGVGLIDLGTLAKIHVGGADAVDFLNRIYIGSFTRQKVGTMRYGVACDETGVIVDDGIVARLSDRQFYLSATTSGGGSFFREMQRWAILWQMQVDLINLTGQYTAINLAGPACRPVLAALTDVDLSAAAFPFSGVRQANVAGTRALLIRVGFIGELGYEIHVPASQGQHVWEALAATGRSANIRPFGVEAQRLLRLEKGHLIVGQDTDALTTPREANLEPLIYRKKRFFIGKRSLEIAASKPLQRTLVGFQYPPDSHGPLPNECNLVIDRGEISGRITSIAHQSTLGMPLGLAHVSPDLAAVGTPLRIRTDDGTMTTCQVTETPFYDPQGERQKV